MVDDFIQTEGRLRPSVFLLPLLLACGVGACGKSESPNLQAREMEDPSANATPWGDAAAAADEGLLWDTPPLPEPIVISLDGEVIPEEIQHAYMTKFWSRHCAEQGFGFTEEELRLGFFAAPEELITPYLRGVILLHEAESRFPALADHDVAHYREQMEFAAGLAFESLIKRMGEDGWQRHVERQFRLRLLQADFMRYATNVTEEDVMDIYDQDVLAKLPTMDAAEGEDVSYAALKDNLRARLEKEAAIDAQEAWIDEQMDGRVVKVVLPDGSEHTWQMHTPKRD